ncbi:hypothetical protein TNCV_3216981 [Trichonephila clavipes]|nr:hypothetical protein TNCV_3216981 [Trichonephila clavipes]
MARKVYEPNKTQLAYKSRTKRSPLGLDSGECGLSIHVFPKITEHAERDLCNMNSMQMFQETVESSGQTKLGNCFTSWSYGKIFKVIPPDLIGISLSVLS